MQHLQTSKLTRFELEIHGYGALSRFHRQVLRCHCQILSAYCQYSSFTVTSFCISSHSKDYHNGTCTTIY